jgi:hypothetical protein
MEVQPTLPLSMGAPYFRQNLKRLQRARFLLDGLRLGLLVSPFSRSRKATPLVLLLAFAPTIAVGGRLWPVPELSPAVRAVAAAMPSHWAFEDLLLMKADANPPVPTIGGPPVSRIDIAET